MKRAIFDCDFLGLSCCLLLFVLLTLNLVTVLVAAKHHLPFNLFFSLFFSSGPGSRRGFVASCNPLSSENLSSGINRRTPRPWGYEWIEMHLEMISGAQLSTLRPTLEGLWLLRISSLLWRGKRRSSPEGTVIIHASANSQGSLLSHPPRNPHQCLFHCRIDCA